jgi:hypothetical protein
MMRCMPVQERGDFRRAAAEAQRGSAADAASAAAQQQRFRAAPVPHTLRAPAQLPPVPEKAPTRAQPFRLASQARHQEVRLFWLPCMPATFRPQGHPQTH